MQLKTDSARLRQSEDNKIIVSPLYAERLTDLRAPSLVEHGRKLVENNSWDAGGYYEPVQLTLPLDWSMNPFNDRTWRWFLHQFEFTRSLLAFDLNSRVTSGYTLLRQFVESWAKLYLHDQSDSDAVWHDHGTALRVRNLLLLRAFMRQNGIQDRDFVIELEEILKVHAKILLSDGFYSKGTNHGLDQNIILFELLKETESEVSSTANIKIAIDRVNYEISKAFAPDGGHVENSAAYLTFGLKQAVDALHVGRSYDGASSLLKLPRGMLERAANVLTHTVRPDGKLPLIGDTSDYVVRDIFRDVKPTNHKQFLYAAHRGKRGSPPAENSIVLQDSGWAIFRSGWQNSDSEPFIDHLHCVFKCGFLSNYHRHDDDMSFVLFYKGKDWIIDGGLYKHSRTDPYRIYLRSANAHNISMPYREKASRVLENSGGTGIFSHSLSDRTCAVSAQSVMFPGYHSSRTFEYYRDSNSIRISDRIFPVSSEKEAHLLRKVQENEYTFVTRFFVPENKRVEFDRHSGICYIVDGSTTLKIATSGKIADFRLTTGQKKPEIKGWISHRPNRLTPCHAIEFFIAMHRWMRNMI